MTDGDRLLIVGASARAAAFSAERAGFEPCWIDQFGDLDLASRFPGERIRIGAYPRDILPLAERAPRGPWLYTGALENHLDVLGRLSRRRPLLGNDRARCRRVRDPVRLARSLSDAGLPAPEVAAACDGIPCDGSWLQKPRRGAGGFGIVAYTDAARFHAGRHYLQRRIEGAPVSGIFVADAQRAELLGVTRQLIGTPEFKVPPFAYCGSIGPVPLPAAEAEAWRSVGDVLAARFGLRGLFGVDAIRANGEIWPVEVNPRYTASVEVLERALAWTLLDLHVQACTGTLSGIQAPPRTPATVGKAYLFAAKDLRTPPDPAALRCILPDGSPGSADIPQPASGIRAGQPIMTVFAEAADESACMTALRQCAARMYAVLDAVQ